MRSIFVVAVAAISMANCDFDGVSPGAEGFCGAAVGQPICDTKPIETADDACWKLVECGSIPIAPPDGVDNPNGFFTYSTCIDRIEGLDRHRRNITLACVQSATCDQLRFDNQNEPRNRSEEMPPCLEYGDQ